MPVPDDAGRPGQAAGGLSGATVLLSVSSFAKADPRPLELLEQAGLQCVRNPYGRRMVESEMMALVEEADAIIAGTEPITERVLERAKRLKIISRVGVGFNSVDLDAARRRNVQVAYTPDAPSAAVAELALGAMICALRGIARADASIRGGGWTPVMGRGLDEITVGVIGVNRIGKLLIRHLAPFGTRLLGNDIVRDNPFFASHGVQWAEKEEIYTGADVVTLHLPLTERTRNMIGPRELALMKPDAILINTARGGLVDEAALAASLREGRLGGAVLDVFEKEPYSGELVDCPNVVMTCHMGSMTRSARARMEFEAAENVVRFLRGEEVERLVPPHP